MANFRLFLFLYHLTHLATGRLAGWEPLRCGIHPRPPFDLNRVGSFFPNLSTYLEHTGALSSYYCHLYISTLYYLPIDIMALIALVRSLYLYQRSDRLSFIDQWLV
jgi:hypothetical protein